MTHSFKALRKLLTMSLTVTLLAAGVAHAQFRTLPPASKRVTVGQQKYPLPYVNFGDKPFKLAPGGVIYDQNNRFILHEALPPGADVIYTVDTNGDIARIYVLTPQEQALLPKPK